MVAAALPVARAGSSASACLGLGMTRTSRSCMGIAAGAGVGMHRRCGPCGSAAMHAQGCRSLRLR